MRTLGLILFLVLIPVKAWAEIESARFLEDGSVEVVEDGKEMIVSSDPANRHWQALDAWVSAGNSIVPYVPSVAELETAIRQEADRRVGAVYDSTMKDRMLARSNELLLNRITNGSFTAGEQAELDALLAANAWVESVRRAAESAIATLPRLTINEKIGFDAARDVTWPTEL